MIAIDIGTTFCDKCGLEVPEFNDARELDALIHNDFRYLLFTPRHLLPIITEDGETVCPGSPSRAQYLKGRPRDPRYAYLPAKEVPSRLAFEQMRAGVN